MKKRFLSIIMTLFCVGSVFASDLIILHTNDTHSQIEPDSKGRGGVLRRKAIIDSVRMAQPNVLLIDAGDAVQGTLYFNVYKGEVEQRVMNYLGYDLRILGNHEFDNGVESLANLLRQDNSTRLSTNYRLINSQLKDLFNNYTIKEFDNRRIGFIGINIDPVGMVAEGNYDGVSYIDAIHAANDVAWQLKTVEHVDMVVAITHIGYDQGDTTKTPGDVQLASLSRGIDLIIGAHSHDTITPAYPKHRYKVANIDGDSVIIAQAAKAGRFIGEITIDLDDMSISSRLITVDSRRDYNVDSVLAGIIDHYRAGVDSIMHVKVAESAVELYDDQPGLLNFISDYLLYQGEQLTGGHIDIAISNKGGIRQSLPKGDITEGEIIMTFPFNNYVRVIDIKGCDLRAALDVMASRDGDGVSRGVDITYDSESDKCVEVIINGQPLDDNKIYRLATIDYLANGGDYMQPLTEGVKVAQSSSVMYEDLLKYLRQLNNKGESINPDNNMRMRPIK